MTPWEPPPLLVDASSERHHAHAAEAFTRFVDVPLIRLGSAEVRKLRASWTEPDPVHRAAIVERRTGAPRLVLARVMRFVRVGAVEYDGWHRHVAMLYAGTLPPELAPCVYGPGFTQGAGARLRRVASVTSVAWYQIVWHGTPEREWRALLAAGMRPETAAALGAAPLG